MLKSYLLWILNMTFHSSGPWRAAVKTKKLFRWMFMNLWILLKNGSSLVISKSWVSASINATPIEEIDINVYMMAGTWLNSHHKPGSRILIRTLVQKAIERNTSMNLHILTVKCNHEIWPVMTSIFKIKLQITQRLFSTITSKNPNWFNPLKVQTSECLWKHTLQEQATAIMEWI